jgi:hypothetical protein
VTDKAGRSATIALYGSFTFTEMPTGLFTLTATRDDYDFGEVQVKVPLYTDIPIHSTTK